MKIIPIYFIMAAFSLLSCKSGEQTADGGETDRSAEETGVQKVTSLKQSMKEIAGSWEWIKTDCCGRMNKTTYAQPGDPQRIISFDEKGNAMYFSGETREKTTAQSYTLGTLGDQPTITIGELTPALFVVQNDTLVISWGYIDLQTEYYERVK